MFFSDHSSSSHTHSFEWHETANNQLNSRRKRSREENITFSSFSVEWINSLILLAIVRCVCAVLMVSNLSNFVVKRHRKQRTFSMHVYFNLMRFANLCFVLFWCFFFCGFVTDAFIQFRLFTDCYFTNFGKRFQCNFKFFSTFDVKRLLHREQVPTGQFFGYFLLCDTSCRLFSSKYAHMSDALLSFYFHIRQKSGEVMNYLPEIRKNET